MIEKYGAIVILSQITKAIKEQKSVLPGSDYVVERLEKLAKEINEEILRDFTGTIQNLSKYMEDVKDD